MKALRLATATAAVMGLLFSIGAGPLRAAGRPYIGTSSADMFWCTSTQAFCTQQTVTRGITHRTSVSLVCWRSDRAPFPGASQKWLYGFLDNGQEGFFWAPQVNDQPPDLPICAGSSGINWVNVADWAIGRLGQAKSEYTPTGSWSNYCATFAYWAWGGNMTRGNAIDMFRHYQAAGMVRQGRPARGGLVFWNLSSYGHVAVSLGNWMTIGTQGFAGDQLPNYLHGVLDGGWGKSYLGWVMPQSPTVPQNPS